MKAENNFEYNLATLAAQALTLQKWPSSVFCLSQLFTLKRNSVVTFFQILFLSDLCMRSSFVNVVKSNTHSHK